MPRLALQKNPWFLALLTLYTVVELSFNHRLLEFASQAFDRDDLDGLEFWGRCLSGCGLGLLLWRWLDRWIPARWLSGLLSMFIGISVMWQAQTRLIDFLLQQASELDKVTSVQRLSMRTLVADGGFTLKGLALGRVGMSDALRDSVKALFPAASLGVDVSELDKQLLTPSALSAPVFDVEEAQQMLNDAYRQTVVLPIALGVSLFFCLAEHFASGLFAADACVSRHPRPTLAVAGAAVHGRCAGALSGHPDLVVWQRLGGLRGSP